MSTFIENRFINLNASNAESRNAEFLSNVFFQFSGLLKDDADIQNVYVSIQNAQFPYSFYNINVYNNLLRLSVGANPPIVLTLTRGNYNANTLITEIQTQLAAALITDITITISSITGLLTFKKTSGDFTLYSSGSTSMKILGFNPSLDYTSIGSSIVAPYPLNLLGTLKLRIASYTLSVSSIDSRVQGSLNILSSIPINAGNFGLIQYENTNNIQNALNLRLLNGFDLEILDDDGNLINFNGAYWTISMLISIERLSPQRTNTTFQNITRRTIMLSEEQMAATEQPVEEPTKEEEEPQQIEPPTGDEAVFVDPPNLEEFIPADDLDLLLYSVGIR